MMHDTQPIFVLDIGSTCVRALIGKNDAQGLEVLSIAEAIPARDAMHAASSPQETARAIEQAAERAMMEARVRVQDVWIAMPSNWITLKNGVGETALDQRQMRRSDLARALENARLPYLSTTRKILHQYDVRIRVDGQPVEASAHGVRGERLRVETRMAICPSRVLSQLLDVVKMAGFSPRGVLLETFAAATATLTPEETQDGVLLVELGARKTFLGIWKDGQARDMVTLETGGHSFAEELAATFRIPIADAIRVQESCSCACHPRLESLPSIDISLASGDVRRVAPFSVAQILEPRVLELFSEMQSALDSRAGHQDIRHVVLTGGGAWMQGLVELAEDYFQDRQWSVRLGLPRGIHAGGEMVSQTRYATVTGLLREASSEHRDRTFYSTEEQGVASQLKKAMAKFFDSFF